MFYLYFVINNKVIKKVIVKVVNYVENGYLFVFVGIESFIL